MINDGPAGQVIVQHNENFNIGIFSDTLNGINVKLCMIVLLIELYLFVPLSVPYFKVKGVSNNFNGKFCVLIQLSLNFIGLLGMSSRS